MSLETNLIFIGGSRGCNNFGYFELLANDWVETTEALGSTLAQQCYRNLNGLTAL